MEKSIEKKLTDLSTTVEMTAMLSEELKK